MKYYSTNGKADRATLHEAVVKGLAGDKGLFMPETIKRLPDSFFEEIQDLSFQEVAYRVADAFFGEDVPTDIEGKKQFLRRRHIALWDSVTACVIRASEDASIREAERADVAGLIRGTAVGTVLCNGKAARRYLDEAALPKDIRVECLPSTSPANPRFSEAAWHAALAKAFSEG